MTKDVRIEPYIELDLFKVKDEEKWLFQCCIETTDNVNEMVTIAFF